MYGEQPGVYVPTKDEIAEACREIQAGWTERERLKRAVWGIGRKREMTLATSHSLTGRVIRKDVDS